MDHRASVTGIAVGLAAGGRELSVLLARAPQSVHRYEGDALVSASIRAVDLGDPLLVKPGEVVPVDGILEGVPAVLDEAALTGEAHPVRRAAGDAVRSGTVNAGPSPFTMRATTAAEDQCPHCDERSRPCRGNTPSSARP